ncbi:hypothetical protein LIER_15491 [Lithospermum erythrorhizon]|uniref:Uncharacterized protein n=1 Tax=Lithospermum erythrorhizon TaxID=34254 RepID=A0AAV3Q772_LITER
MEGPEEGPNTGGKTQGYACPSPPGVYGYPCLDIEGQARPAEEVAAREENQPKDDRESHMAVTLPHGNKQAKNNGSESDQGQNGDRSWSERRKGATVEVAVGYGVSRMVRIAIKEVKREALANGPSLSKCFGGRITHTQHAKK